MTSQSEGPTTNGADKPGTGRYYPAIVAAFVSMLVISNVAATKGIQFGPLLTDGGAFLFPLTYIFGDVLAEVYGFRAARRAIFLGFSMNLVASLCFYLVLISPAAPGYQNQAAFAAVLGVVPRILLASMCGYLAGQLLNALVVVVMKRRSAQQRRLWARLIGSTVAGEAADTLIFCAIAAPAIGMLTPGDFWNYAVVGYCYKCLVEVLLLPLTYRVIGTLKRRER